MGHKVTQRILQCAECGGIPQCGEYLWEMPNGHWCEECCNKHEEKDEEASAEVE